ncbi:MAG: hypothetical protein J6S83_11065 [Lachnospiraceae bacterium]|nr:hypothetical protein [Lachnospiraceae bacterium]
MNATRTKMTAEAVRQIWELMGKEKDSYHIAGKLGLCADTVGNYIAALRNVKAGRIPRKVDKKLITTVAKELGLPEPIWKEKKTEIPAEEPEQLPGQLKMELPEEPAAAPERTVVVWPEDETQAALKRISDQLEQISKAMWALVKGGGAK